MKIPFYQVDTFCKEAFSGNPAGVCLLEESIDERLMQAIAAENNLSETAFVVEREGSYSIRWFTPKKEVDLCGHATLASAFVLSRFSKPSEHRFIFSSASGKLSVEVTDGALQLNFPSIPTEEEIDASEIAKIIGCKPRHCYSAPKILAVLESEQEVRNAKPDLDALCALGREGLLITAPGEDCDFVSRFFAPQYGIPEDPVTGSAHCILTPYWSERLGKTELLARQVSARGGELLCEYQGERTLISGTAVLFLKGDICI